MQREKQLELILDDKSFPIPFNFPAINDVDPNIYQILRTKNKYSIKSKVNEQTLANFIDNWVNQTIPYITIGNISEYSQLSQEFNRMQNILKLYNTILRSHEDKQQKLQKVFQEKKGNLDQNFENYQKIISYLFNSEVFFEQTKKSMIQRRIYYECCSENVKIVYMLTQNEVIDESGLTYILNEEDETAELIGNSSINDEIIVPDSVYYESKNYPVVSIFEGAFLDCKNIKTIQFSTNSQIKLIDKNAFKNSSLKTITIPKSVVEIGEGAFSHCKKIESVQFEPESELKIIHDYSFHFSSLKSIIIPSSVVRICVDAFSENKNLRIIKFEENSKLEIIENGAFSMIPIKEIRIPASVTHIGPYSFSYCNNLNYVEFENNSKLVSIDKKQFLYCSLSKLELPSCVKELNSRWFDEIRNISIIQIKNEEKENIQIINNEFLVGKSDEKSDVFDVLLLADISLKSVEIPPFIKKIAPNAFRDCEQLTSITFSIDSKLEEINKSAFSHSTLSYLQIPTNFNKFADGWCKGLSSLNEISIMPHNKNFIYFDNKLILGKSDPLNDEYDVIIFARRDIKEVIIPSFITRIESYSFEFCTLLTTVVFSPNSKLEFIGEYAFSSSLIMDIIIPSSVKQICVGAFLGCNFLGTVEFEENSKLTTIERITFFSSSLQNITIPDSVEYINYGAFHQTYDMEYIEFSPDSKLKCLDDSVFYESSLEYISIPSSVSKLGDNWCHEIKNLVEINVIDSTLSKSQNIIYFDDKFIIGKSDLKSENYDLLLFARRDILTAKIPSFIKKIQPYCFEYCKNLLKIEFENDSQLHFIGNQAFVGTSIIEINIPSNVTELGNYSFKNCKYLKKVVFGNHSKLQKIGNHAFDNTSVTSLSIPNDVLTLDTDLFSHAINIIIIELSDKSKLNSIKKSYFQNWDEIIFFIPFKSDESAPILIEESI